MNGIWTQWKPIKNLAPKYDVDLVVDTMKLLEARSFEELHLYTRFILAFEY